MAAAVLTLIGVPRYTLAFGARCLFIALGAMLAGTGAGMAEERVENVLLGGALGIVSVVLVDAAGWLWTRIYPDRI